MSMSLPVIDNPGRIHTHIHPAAQRPAAEEVKVKPSPGEASTSYLARQSAMVLLAEVIELGRQYVDQVERLQSAASLLDHQLDERALEVFAKKLENAAAELSSRLSMLAFFKANGNFAEYLSPITEVLGEHTTEVQDAGTEAYRNSWQALADLQQRMSDQLAQVNRLALDIHRTLSHTLVPPDPQENLEYTNIPTLRAHNGRV